jgi:hypothetical protein
MEVAQRRGGWAGFRERRIEETRQILLGVTGDRELPEPLRAAVDEDEEVATACTSGSS